ncbi:hypothetical protein LJC20_01435 [Eubacteriales bacterium OttesenSCG-928-M02]|nr:hypothetical protein [Eubacteriales bacterium OttesenSCG-928-M02]
MEQIRKMLLHNKLYDVMLGFGVIVQLLLVLLSFRYRILVPNNFFCIFFLLCYWLLHLFLNWRMSKDEEHSKNVCLLFFIFSYAILLLESYWLSLPVIFLVLNVIHGKYWLFSKVISAIISFCLICILGFWLIAGNSPTEYMRIPSPNGELVFSYALVDLGGAGYGTRYEVEKQIVPQILSLQKKIPMKEKYLEEARWINEETLEINGKQYKVGFP